MMVNIVLCGGSGTRLWPLSRRLLPKQFAKIFSDKSLFQKSVERNMKLCSKRVIVSNTEHYFMAYDQLEETGAQKGSSFLLEPIGRNTAPAIILAALSLEDDDIVLVTPSDHVIEDEESYKECVKRASKLAEEGYIVTFGIEPTAPETGYGYIEAEGEDVKAFHEKPDRERAVEYLERGNYYWNSGMFCFKVSTILEEARKYAPEIYEAASSAWESARKDGSVGRIDMQSMLSIPEESIDYAVMEKSSGIKVIAGNFGWNDLGSFDALESVFEKDENGNSVNDKLITIDATNNFFYGTQRVVALLDVEDLIVVDTPDALLVGKKGSSQKIKDVVARLREEGSQLPHIHMTAYRPWGSYTVLEEADRYKIKRIEVKPGKRLSLQKHYHRSEHWIVVSGTALVRVGEDEKIVRANESVYIPMGELHRLENPGKITLVLVEAQVGEYTGEDDIVRIEDDYKRER
jgi:mannose-1-phosphate guanylyltransferase